LPTNLLYLLGFEYGSSLLSANLTLGSIGISIGLDIIPVSSRMSKASFPCDITKPSLDFLLLYQENILGVEDLIYDTFQQDIVCHIVPFLLLFVITMRTHIQ